MIIEEEQKKTAATNNRSENDRNAIIRVRTLHVRTMARRLVSDLYRTACMHLCIRLHGGGVGCSSTFFQTGI